MFGDDVDRNDVDRNDVDRAARAHALGDWPHEACGVLSDGHYVRLPNIAADPAQGFEMPADTWLTHRPQAVIHSHNAQLHPHWPSRADMESQIAADVPFGIVSCDGEVTTPILWWGDAFHLRKTRRASGERLVLMAGGHRLEATGGDWAGKRSRRGWDEGESLLLDRLARRVSRRSRPVTPAPATGS